MSFAWIDDVPEDAADAARLARMHADLGAPGGHGLDHVLKIHGRMPRTLTDHLAFYRGIMREKGPLSRVEREVIGVVVSARNGCHY